MDNIFGAISFDKTFGAISFDKTFDLLNSNKVILASGFAVGFVYAFKLTKDTLNYPLTTLFGAAVEGALTLFGTAFIVDFFPQEIRFVIPLTVAASCIYWKYCDLFHNKKNKPLFSFKMKTTRTTTNNTTDNQQLVMKDDKITDIMVNDDSGSDDEYATSVDKEENKKD